MIIGIPTDDGRAVSGHFGKSKYFAIIEVDKGIEKNRKIVENPHNKEENEQSGHGKLLKMLVDNKVNAVICVDLNPRMKDNLGSLKIEVNMCGYGQAIDDLVRGIQPV